MTEADEFIAEWELLRKRIDRAAVRDTSVLEVFREIIDDAEISITAFRDRDEGVRT